MKRTVLITRPEEDALPLAETLRARDLRVLIEPMLRIKPIRDVAFDVTGVQALLFTSSNGIRAFAALDRRRDLPVFTTGEASARVARNLGFKTVEAADGDVAGLVRMVRHRLKPEDGPLFHGAGSVVAGELATQIADAGFDLRRDVIYEAVQADALSPQLLQRLSDRQIDMVLLFSPRTAETFVNLIKGLGDQRDAVERGLGGTIALCFSPAVADAARALPWRSVEAAERPDLGAMLGLIERTNATLDAEAVLGTGPEAVPMPEARPAAPVADPRTPDLSPAPVRAETLPSRRARGWVWVSAAVIAGFVVLAALATIPAWSPWTDDTPVSSTGTFADGSDDATTAETTAADDTVSPDVAADATAASGTDATISAADTAAASAGTTGNEATAASSATAGNDTLETIPFASAGLPEAGEPLAEPVAAVDEPAAVQESQAATVPAADGSETGAPSSAGPANAAEIEALAERVTGIEQLLIDFMTEVPAQSLADVKAEVQRLIDENAGLRNQLAILTDRFEQADATAFMLAVGRLGAALNEGRPFAPELDTLNKLASADPQLTSAAPALEALAPHAATGAPSEIRLVARFPETARAIVQAAQQDDASGVVDAEEGGWFDGLIGRVTDLVTVRPVGADVEGDSPAARVARAEAHLQTGDLESAVVELELLTGAPAEAAAAWLADAQARLAVEPAFRTLDQLALERLGTGSPGADADTAAGG